MVANVAWLGAGIDAGDPERCTSILLLHEREQGWQGSQFNADTLAPLWSSFRQPHLHGVRGPLAILGSSGSVGVELELERTSRPCTSQCAPFAGDQYLRWQSETGVVARGRWRFGEEAHEQVEAVGYHERVRGHWGWPELGGWVFGFANDAAEGATPAPPTAIVFTLIQPPEPGDAPTSSVMVWRDGRLVRHFPRRRVTVAVRGELDRPASCRCRSWLPCSASPGW